MNWLKAAFISAHWRPDAPQWAAPQPSVEPQRPILTLNDIDSSLNGLCSFERLTGEQCLPAENFERISYLLKALDSLHHSQSLRRWQLLPRTYCILRNIGGLELMDAFLKNQCTDFMLPYSPQTLPRFLADETIRQNFLYYQKFVLSPARVLELREGTHLYLTSSGDDHFYYREELGQGGFGYFDPDSL